VADLWEFEVRVDSDGSEEPDSNPVDVEALAGCPAGPPNFCNLPPMIPAEAVETSVAIGPDGVH
jgi:hypothetical protein